MPLKVIKQGHVEHVPPKKTKLFGGEPQRLVYCDDMSKVQRALLLKPKVPFWQRKEI